MTTRLKSDLEISRLSNVYSCFGQTVASESLCWLHALELGQTSWCLSRSRNWNVIQWKHFMVVCSNFGWISSFGFNYSHKGLIRLICLVFHCFFSKWHYYICLGLILVMRIMLLVQSFGYSTNPLLTLMALSITLDTFNQLRSDTYLQPLVAQAWLIRPNISCRENVSFPIDMISDTSQGSSYLVVNCKHNQTWPWTFHYLCLLFEPWLKR